MTKEPWWRLVLCWGVVITYLTAPLVFFVVHLNASKELDERLMHSSVLRDFYISITGTLFSLTGLNTFQAVANGRKPEPKEK